jgi:hypothetical protein
MSPLDAGMSPLDAGTTKPVWTPLDAGITILVWTPLDATTSLYKYLKKSFGKSKKYMKKKKIEILKKY